MSFDFHINTTYKASNRLLSQLLRTMMNKFGRNPTKDLHYEFENDQRNCTSQTNLYQNQSADIEKDISNGPLVFSYSKAVIPKRT